MARTDTLELYAHECRQDLWTVSNRERVARRAACHLSVAGAQVLGQVKVVGAVGVVVLTVLLTVRVVPAPAPLAAEGGVCVFGDPRRRGRRARSLEKEVQLPAPRRNRWPVRL